MKSQAYSIIFDLFPELGPCSSDQLVPFFVKSRALCILEASLDYAKTLSGEDVFCANYAQLCADISAAKYVRDIVAAVKLFVGTTFTTVENAKYFTILRRTLAATYYSASQD